MDILYFMIKNFFVIFNRVKNQGQTTVEYLLLLAVVVILLTSFFNSARFQNYLGRDGTFFTTFGTIISYQYRYPLAPSTETFQAQDSYSGFDHDTFTGQGNDTRFNIPLEAYPNN